MKYKLTNECGQKWYRLHSWKACGIKPRMLTVAGNHIGVACGPVMFFWKWS